MPIYLPERCLRNRKDCEPYAQIEVDDGSSFICMGRNNGNMSDQPGDIFTHCWKNETVDEMTFWDERDIIDTISVLAQGLSAHENKKQWQN